MPVDVVEAEVVGSDIALAASCVVWQVGRMFLVTLQLWIHSPGVFEMK